MPYNEWYQAILPDYGAKRGCGISVVDPGAVPGGSTKTAQGI